MSHDQAETGTGRPLTKRGRETRQRIVAAAAELMFDNGAAETTLEDIRAAAGVSGSQVYHYFEDKQALVRAVIDYQTDAVLDAQCDHLDHLDTVGGLRAWRDFLVEHQRRLGCRGGCPIGALGAEVAETDAVARLAAARGLRRWEDRIRDGLRAMHERGDLRADADPEDLALAVLAALQGGLLLTQLQRDTRPLEVTLDAMLDRIEALAGPPDGRNVPLHRLLRWLLGRGPRLREPHFTEPRPGLLLANVPRWPRTGQTRSRSRC